MKKKKDAQKLGKLKLNRETLRALNEPELKVVNGGASDLYSCKPCNTAGATCRC